MLDMLFYFQLNAVYFIMLSSPVQIFFSQTMQKQKAKQSHLQAQRVPGG
jgi:hypothetical protein